MELPELEPCDAGGWKARFDPDQFDKIAYRIRDSEDLDVAVDTEHMLLWHVDDVKISFVQSSGVMTIRTEEKEHAHELLEQAIIT